MDIKIAVILCVISLTFTTSHWILKIRKDERDFEACIKDIRVMNTYNSYFLAGILIFFGLIIEKGVELVPESSLYLLIAAFLFASLAIFFIPLKRPSSGAGAAKKLWLYTLIFTQLTVIVTLVGVISAVVVRCKLF